MGELRDAYDATVKANAQLDTKVDAALVEAGRKIADEIDNAVENLTGQERTKALYLTPHLMNVLREMHATPKARTEAGIEKTKGGAGGKLAQLQSLKGGKSA